MKIKKNNLKGQSIVEILVGAAIVLGGGAIAVSLTSQYLKINKKAEVKSASSSFAGELASLGRKMFLATIDSTGKNTQGLCTFVGTTGSSGGVSRIYLNIPKTDGALATAWKTAIESSNWSINTAAGETTCVGAASDFNKCFIHKTYFGNVTDPKTKVVTINQKVVGSLQITPQYLEEGKEKGFLFQDLTEAQKSMNLDIKRVAFKILSKVTTYSGDSSVLPTTEVAESLVWGADSGGCDKQIGSTWYKLAPSGSGQGDPTGKTIFNDTSYVFKETLPFTGSWEKRQIQAGTFDSGLVRTKPEDNIEMSCNETRFTCTNDDSSNRQFASNIEANYFLTYNDKTNTVTRDSSIRFVPWLTFSNPEEGSLEVSGENLQLKFDGVNSPNELRVTGGSHELYFYANNDKTKVCSKICTLDNTVYYPTLNYRLPDFKDEKDPKKVYTGTLSSSAPVGCTVCYMKDCKRFGLKTFGPLKGGRGVIAQPDEPLDGTIPECAIKSESDVDSLVVKLNNYNTSGTGDCISAKVEDAANGVFSYQRQSCTSSLPLMCFAYGKFTLAKKVSTSGTSYESLPQSSASARCYQMGKETFDKTKIKGLVSQSYSDSKEASGVSAVIDTMPGTSVSIVNNAVQGIFLAPQSERQRKYAAEWLGEKHTSVMRNSFWVGLRVDSMGNPYSEIPWIQSLSATENKIENQFSIFFNQDSQISVLRHDKDLKVLNIAAPVGAGAGALISHHVRYKGVIPVKAEQSAEYPFICRKKAAPYKFFVTTDKSAKQSEGPDSCSKAGGWFLPPVTPLQWAKVFHLVKGNHINYSFPDPEGALSLAWIALTGDGSKRTESWNVYSGGEMGQFQASLAKSTLKQIYRSGADVVPASSNASATESTPPGDSKSESTSSIDSSYACFSSDGKIILDSKENACKGIGAKLTRAEMKSFVVQALWLLDSDESKEKGILLD
jgi:hypothetical protein